MPAQPPVQPFRGGGGGGGSGPSRAAAAARLFGSAFIIHVEVWDGSAAKLALILASLPKKKPQFLKFQTESFDFFRLISAPTESCLSIIYSV